MPITRIAHRLRSGEIKDSEVKRSDIADSAITSAKIQDSGVETGDIADGAINSAKILDGTIATGDIGDNAVTPAKSTLLYGTVDNQELRTGVVSGAATDSTGTHSIDFTHSAFNNAMDSALGILEDLTDTAAELDNIRITDGSKTVSGATITYDVKASGASGSNAAFRFLSLGH